MLAPGSMRALLIAMLLLGAVIGTAGTAAADDPGGTCKVNDPYVEHSGDPTAMWIDAGFTGNGSPIECYY